MAISSSSVLLLATIMLAFLSHANADVAQAQAAAQQSVLAVQAATTVANKYTSGSTGETASTCLEVFNDAVDQLNRCFGILKAYSPIKKNDVQTYGSAALTDVGTCDDEFGSAEPADLKQASGNAQKVIGNFLGIVNNL